MTMPARQQPHELSEMERGITDNKGSMGGEVAVSLSGAGPGGADWRDKAKCKGMETELFFPERGPGTKEAKAACQGCIVREVCLDFALANGEKFGIWGGLSERERRRIRRQRALAEAATT